MLVVFGLSAQRCNSMLAIVERYRSPLFDFGQRFCRHQHLLWASALTYISLFGLVPFLTLAFATLNGLGLPNVLEPLIIRQLTGNSQEMAVRLLGFVKNSNAVSLGGFGLLSLFVAVLLLMDSITDAFNIICEVRETRPLWRRLVEYLAIALLGPLVLAAVISMTSLVQSQRLVLWLVSDTLLAEPLLLAFGLVPYLVISAALTLFYWLIPNQRLSFVSVAVGGITAGLAWQAAHWAYFHFQFGVARFNAIYGIMALLPFLLVWLYLSWLIVLAGLELAVMHNRRTTEVAKEEPV